MKKFHALFLSLFLFNNIINAQTSNPGTIISVDFNKELGIFKPAWAWFGYDEPNYTYMKDGKKLLSELSAMPARLNDVSRSGGSPVPVYVRAHNLLNTGDGTAAFKWGSTNIYTEDAEGNAIYDWTIIDRIFDTYIERGMKPLAEMGFMPEALSSKPVPYRHYWKSGDPYDDIYTGWRFPPEDYKKWGELIYQWVKHSAERYGKQEVESWCWELWNEPDAKYWGGTVSSFAKIYDIALDYNINLLGIVTWAFEFEDQPWFHGFRDLATNGVDKPVLNVFRMFGKMGNTRIEAKSNSGFSYRGVIDSGVRGSATDIGAIATKSQDDVTVMFWNYHDDDKTSPDAMVEFDLHGIPVKKVMVTQYRIDRDNSNSYEVWKEMGSPQNPSAEQYKQLEKAGMLALAGSPGSVKVKKGIMKIKTQIQRQGVGLLKISWTTSGK